MDAFPGAPSDCSGTAGPCKPQALCLASSSGGGRGGLCSQAGTLTSASDPGSELMLSFSRVRELSSPVPSALWIQGGEGLNWDRRGGAHPLSSGSACLLLSLSPPQPCTSAALVSRASL